MSRETEVPELLRRKLDELRAQRKKRADEGASRVSPGPASEGISGASESAPPRARRGGEAHKPSTWNSRWADIRRLGIIVDPLARERTAVPVESNLRTKIAQIAVSSGVLRRQDAGARDARLPRAPAPKSQTPALVASLLGDLGFPAATETTLLSRATFVNTCPGQRDIPADTRPCVTV